MKTVPVILWQSIEAPRVCQWKYSTEMFARKLPGDEVFTSARWLIEIYHVQVSPFGDQTLKGESPTVSNFESWLT